MTRDSAKKAIQNLKSLFDLESRSNENDDWISLDDSIDYDVCDQLKVGFEPTNNLRGIYTLMFLNKGLIIGEYTGTLIRSKKVINNILDQGPPYYIVKLDKTTWIDAKFTGNILSLINHSCIESNCIMYRISPTRVVLKLSRDVYPNEFLHLNYQHQFRIGLNKQFKCLCHSECKNFIG